MKKLMHYALIMLAFCSSAFSQTLQNTTWDVYNSSNVLQFKFYIGTDTVFISQNLVTFQPLSFYTEYGNTFTIHDIDGTAMACPAADTGRYTFAITNDSLLFTLISDPCGQRTAVLTTYFWVQNTIGLETLQPFQAIQVFPNPSADGIFTLRINEPGFDMFSVYTLEGRLILETMIADEVVSEYVVSLAGFESGIYLLNVHSKQGNSVYKLVR